MPDHAARAMFPDALTDARAPAIAHALIEGFNRHYTLFRQASREAQRVVTVRMPRSLHESLKAEAEDMRVSINSLCISKLLKMLDDEERRDLASKRDEEGPEAA